MPVVVLNAAFVVSTCIALLNNTKLGLITAALKGPKKAMKLTWINTAHLSHAGQFCPNDGGECVFHLKETNYLRTRGSSLNRLGCGISGRPCLSNLRSESRSFLAMSGNPCSLCNTWACFSESYESDMLVKDTLHSSTSRQRKMLIYIYSCTAGLAGPRI